MISEKAVAQVFASYAEETIGLRDLDERCGDGLPERWVHIAEKDPA